VTSSGASWRIRAVRHAIGCPANGAERHGSTGVRDAGTARFLGREADLGTVERGKLADLVLLDKCPLTDIANTRAIAAVVANGATSRALTSTVSCAMSPQQRARASTHAGVLRTGRGGERVHASSPGAAARMGVGAAPAE
jgi:hypothetical protein